MATYDITTQDFPSVLLPDDHIQCSYTGSYKSILLPAGLYQLTCYGGAGGGYNPNGQTNNGGSGGIATGVLFLTDELTQLYLYVGGMGQVNSSSSTTPAYLFGGWNGGGRSYYSSNGYRGSGGGASDIRIGTNSLYARVIVAGGGGGGAYMSNYGSAKGGNGGGTTGGAGNVLSGVPGAGGSETTGGSSGAHTQVNNPDAAPQFGYGGSAVNSGNYSFTGTVCGGGGGWYGGACGNAGGGGSGYVYTADTAYQYPTGCLLNSKYYLTNASTITQTLRIGNGLIDITVLDMRPPMQIYLKVDVSTWKQIN